MIIFVVMCLLYTHNLWVTRYVQLDIKQTPYCSRVQKSPHDQQDKAPLSLSLSLFLSTHGNWHCQPVPSDD